MDVQSLPDRRLQLVFDLAVDRAAVVGVAVVEVPLVLEIAVPGAFLAHQEAVDQPRESLKGLEM